MNPGTALLLARAGGRAQPRRFALLAGAAAAAGALLLGTARIGRLPVLTYSGQWKGLVEVGPGGGPQQEDLARYVIEEGLRPGILLAVSLLTIPVLALGVQALRVGSLARDRRMAALRLAGGTTGEVRYVAAVEAAAAAAAGGVLAGPVYLLLWVFVGVLPPQGARLLPAPDFADVLVWPLVVLLVTTAGAVAGSLVQGRVITEPLGVRRRAVTDQPGAPSLALLIIGAVLVVGSLGSLFVLPAQSQGGLLVFACVVLGALLAAFAGGPRLVQTRAAVLLRSHDPVDLLAASRLRADPRSPGRVGAVLMLCGVVLGVEAVFLADLFTSAGGVGQLAFYLGGFALAAAAVLTAVAVAVLTLLVGAVDQLLDARRPLASLAALGVDHSTLARMLRTQLYTVASTAVVVGVLVGGVGAMVLAAASQSGHASSLVAIAAAAALMGPAIALITRAAAHLLDAQLETATNAENLRTP